MKRFIAILVAFMFLSLNFNNINTFAQSESKTLTQGIYNVRDANLLIGNPITISISPANTKAIVLVIDSDQTLEALVRLNPKVPQQVLPPLNYGSSIIIFTNGSVVFS